MGRHLSAWQLQSERLEQRILLTAFTIVEKSDFVFQEEPGAWLSEMIDIDNDQNIDVTTILSRGSFAVTQQSGDAQFDTSLYDTRPNHQFIQIFEDFDRDQDVDFLFGSDSGELMVAVQDQGRFLPPRLIGQFDPDKRVDESIIIDMIDLDSDGDLDVPPEPYGQWLENVDGTYVDRQFPIQDWPLLVTDFDLDGDIDAITTSTDADNYGVLLHENVGDLQFNPPKLLNALDPSVFTHPTLLDIDGDGDSDFIHSNRHDSSPRQLLVYQNDGASVNLKQTIDMGELSYLEPKRADINGDGLSDLLVSHFGLGSANPQFYWLENDSGTYLPPQQITEMKGPIWDFQDINRNGLIEVTMIERIDFDSNRLVIGEIRPIGDSNADGQFDSRDLVHVFQSTEYADNVANNSTFDEGDWNRDGEFNSEDLTFVFQSGNYQHANRKIAAALDFEDE